ncbi:MAG: hypothetical protein ABSF71_01595 [Terriglobia bacterium]|jgi:hypothetical protein
MPTDQELTHAAECLHEHLLKHHYDRGLVHGPDAGVRFNLRLWRFLKAGLPFIPWRDDYVFMQSQGYWILSNWMLHESTGEQKYRTLALESTDATIRLQQPEGFWLYPLPERKHLIATVEGDWGAIGLLATYAREPREELLHAAVRWYDYLVERIGFQPYTPGEAINYFDKPRGRIPNNSVEAVWLFLRLWKASGDARFLEHVDAMLDFLGSAQLPTGELPYIVDGPHEKGRTHYLCYQYNAFQFLKLAWAAALRPDPRIERLLSALAGFLSKCVTQTGASAADCFHSKPETDYYTAVLAAALREARKLQIGDCRLPILTHRLPPPGNPQSEVQELSDRCYRRLLQRQRPDGSFAYTTGDYGFLSDGRSYPRPQVMTLYHLLYPACGNGFERTVTSDK